MHRASIKLLEAYGAEKTDSFVFNKDYLHEKERFTWMARFPVSARRLLFSDRNVPKARPRDISFMISHAVLKKLCSSIKLSIHAGSMRQHT